MRNRRPSSGIIGRAEFLLLKQAWNTAGAYELREIKPRYEVAEMPVIADGKEDDRILLNRIDPTRFKFIARNAPAGDKGIDECEKALPNAVLIVNGSYFRPPCASRHSDHS